LVLVLLFDECSLESPVGELSVELDDDECSLVVAGATEAGATITGAGATTTGAGYTVTTRGGGGEFVVSLDDVVSVV
jgi:hypothetical protein